MEGNHVLVPHSEMHRPRPVQQRPAATGRQTRISHHDQPEFAGAPLSGADVASCTHNP
jgi:hypothetical protein